MKAISTYITEKFQVSKDNIRKYKYYPKDKDELIECIKEKLEEEGLGTEDNPLDLNDIDTSKITDMSYLFDTDYEKLSKLSLDGYFDISDWNVSNVENMRYMFSHSGFNGDISDWDVSKVNNMGHMFEYSEFNSDISNWNVSKVNDMGYMFTDSAFTGKNGDISNWNVGNVENMYGMFTNCPLEKNPPKWYKE